MVPVKLHVPTDLAAELEKKFNDAPVADGIRYLRADLVDKSRSAMLGVLKTCMAQTQNVGLRAELENMIAREESNLQ